MNSDTKEGFRSIYLMLKFENDRFSIIEEQPKQHTISKYTKTTSREILAASEEKLIQGYIYYDIISQEGRVLYSGVFHDPIDLRVEFQPERGSLRSTIITQKTASYAVTIPYFAKAVSIRLKRVNREMQLVNLGISKLKGHYAAGRI